MEGSRNSSSIQGLKNRKYRPIFRRYFVYRRISTRNSLSNVGPAKFRFLSVFFGDISGFYRFFPNIGTVHESALFTTVHNRLLFIAVHKMKNLLLRRFEPCPKVQGSNLLSTRLILVLVIYITKL